MTGLDTLPTRRLSEFERGREPRYGVCGKYVISGDVTLLDGAGGLGKSTLLLGIAAAGSVGRDLFSREGIEPFRTLMFTTEDDGDALLDRYDFFRGDPDLLELVDRPLDLSSMATLDSLRTTIVEGGFGFVVLDPGLTYMGRRANINDPKEVNDFMLGLRGVARETGAAILVVRHFRKGAKFSEIEEKGGGTNQFRDAARSQLVMFRNPKNRSQRVVVHAKGNLRTEEQPPFGFEWDGPRFSWIMPGTLDPSDWEGK